MMKPILLIFIICIGCSNSPDNSGEVVDPSVDPPISVKPSFNKVANILYNSPNEEYVMVLAHRGGIIETPENSLSAIENSTNQGVDVVELDVQVTKDNLLVIMHDTSLDRTTNGTGEVNDYTLDELKAFKLKNPNGSLSDQRIPSLKEALEFSKDKVHLFIDKGDDYLDLIYSDLLTTNTLDQTLIGGTLTWSEFNAKFAEIADKLNYIPRAGTGQSLDYINSFEQGIIPVAYFPSCDLISSNNDVYVRIKEINKWIISTTLKGSNCSEETFDPKTIWDWEIQQGVDGIFTDKPQELVNYLNSKGLHQNE